MLIKIRILLYSSLKVKNLGTHIQINDILEEFNIKIFGHVSMYALALSLVLGRNFLVYAASSSFKLMRANNETERRQLQGEEKDLQWQLFIWKTFNYCLFLPSLLSTFHNKRGRAN